MSDSSDDSRTWHIKALLEMWWRETADADMKARLLRPGSEDLPEDVVRSLDAADITGVYVTVGRGVGEGVPLQTRVMREFLDEKREQAHPAYRREGGR